MTQTHFSLPTPDKFCRTVAKLYLAVREPKHQLTWFQGWGDVQIVQFPPPLFPAPFAIKYKLFCRLCSNWTDTHGPKLLPEEMFVFSRLKSTLNNIISFYLYLFPSLCLSFSFLCFYFARTVFWQYSAALCATERHCFKWVFFSVFLPSFLPFPFKFFNVSLLSFFHFFSP